MVGKYKQLTLEEYGKLISLLSQYQENLIHEYQVRIINGEDSQDEELQDNGEDPQNEDPRYIDLCKAAIENFDKCIKRVVDDLQYCLSKYR